MGQCHIVSHEESDIRCKFLNMGENIALVQRFCLMLSTLQACLIFKTLTFISNNCSETPIAVIVIFILIGSAFAEVSVNTPAIIFYT